MKLDFNLENKITNKRKAFGEYIFRCFFVTRNGGILMREITVNYLILDEEEERLKRITEEYRKQVDIPTPKCTLSDLSEHLFPEI